MDDFSNLREILTLMLGKEASDKVVEGRIRSSTPLRNIDVKPEHYIPTARKPRFASNLGSGVKGEYSPFFGGIVQIPMPRYWDNQESTLAHEGQHHLTNTRDAGSYEQPGLFDEATKKKNKQAEEWRQSRLQEIMAMVEKTKKFLPGLFYNYSNELIPNIREYAASQPAWKRLEATDLWKELNQKQKAVLLDELSPVPKGYDAIAGINYNF